MLEKATLVGDNMNFRTGFVILLSFMLLLLIISIAFAQVPENGNHVEIPEFSATAAGFALGGAAIVYLLARRRRVE